MVQLCDVEDRATAEHPLAGSFEIALHVLVGHRPRRIRRDVPLDEVDTVIGNAPSTPDRGCTAELAADRQLDRCVNIRVLPMRYGQLLILRALFPVPGLDQDDVDASLAASSAQTMPAGPAPMTTRPECKLSPCRISLPEMIIAQPPRRGTRSRIMLATSASLITVLASERSASSNSPHCERNSGSRLWAPFTRGSVPERKPKVMLGRSCSGSGPPYPAIRL